MIISKKGKIVIDGTKTDILTELSLIIDKLTKDIEEDKIMFSVKLGLAGDNILKKIELAKAETEKIMEKKRNGENKK